MVFGDAVTIGDVKGKDFWTVFYSRTSTRWDSSFISNIVSIAIRVLIHLPLSALAVFHDGDVDDSWLGLRAAEVSPACVVCYALLPFILPFVHTRRFLHPTGIVILIGYLAVAYV